MTTLFGIFFALIGFSALAVHVASAAGKELPRVLRFRKLDRMRQFWGHRLGTALHVFGYVAVPIAFGAYLLLGGH